MTIVSRNQAMTGIFGLKKSLEPFGLQEALESSYELCFNAACALIDEGRLKEAEASRIRESGNGRKRHQTA